MLNFGSVAPIDGLAKPFDTKFQIPKLSAQKKDQTAAHLNPASSSNIQLSSLMSSQTQSGCTSSTTSKSDGNASKMLLDFFSGNDKYPPPPYSLSKYPTDLTNVNQMNLPYPLTNLTKMGIRSSTSPKYLSSDLPMNKEMNLFKSASSTAPDSLVSSAPKDFRDKQISTSNPSTPTNTIAPPFPSPGGIHHRSLENSPSRPTSESPKLGQNFPIINQSMRPPSAPPNVSSSSSHDSLKPSENALDFSCPPLAKSDQIKLLEQQQRTCMQTLPIHKGNPPPSVQLHIVKSPVPSPMVPHSSSPCIDDELMDEASLVGIGSK